MEQSRNKTYYLSWAERQWTWFQNSGLINFDNLINDGLELRTCRNDYISPTWTYNQGVILGGLVELCKAVDGNSSCLDRAHDIASAAIDRLTVGGILHEHCEPKCGRDGAQFKGVFMRNLIKLQLEDPQNQYEDFIKANANSIWKRDRSNQSELGLVWSGPFIHPANARAHSSAMDALVAAAASLRASKTF